MRNAVLEMAEDLQVASGTLVALGKLEAADGRYVDVEGTVQTLWEPSSPKIAQVGLLSDETGKTKFTSWVKSRAPIVAEGDRVRNREAARNWYRGCCSIVLIGWTIVTFPERDAWWGRAGPRGSSLA